jgi:hypothetical protein
MIRKTLALTAAALLCMAAAPAQKAAPQKPAPKPAPKASAARPADAGAGNPQSLIDLLTAAGAKVETNRREEDSVFVAFTTPVVDFSVQFAGCNPNGRACQAMLFDAVMGQGAPTLAQINSFNQSSVICRGYQDKGGKPHVTYATLVMAADGRDRERAHVVAWQGCLADFGAFVKDPAGYLAVAP